MYRPLFSQDIFTPEFFSKILFWYNTICLDTTKQYPHFFSGNKKKYLFLLAVLLPMILGAPQERFLS
jgi:hypothetical protein